MNDVPEPLGKKGEKKNLQLRGTVNTADMKKKKGCFGGLAERRTDEYSDSASIFKSMSKRRERNPISGYENPIKILFSKNRGEGVRLTRIVH